MRVIATRRPRSAARSASRSHSTQTPARKSSPGGRALVDRLVAARAVVAGRRLRDERSRAARVGSSPSAATRLRVPSTRESRISWLAARRSSAGRRARRAGGRSRRARPAPRRAEARPRVAPLERVDATPEACSALAGSRDSTVTSSPRSRSAPTSSRPSIPVAPVTVTFTASTLRRSRRLAAWIRSGGSARP